MVTQTHTFYKLLASKSNFHLVDPPASKLSSTSSALNKTLIHQHWFYWPETWSQLLNLRALIVSLETCFSSNKSKPCIVECCSKDNFKKMREVDGVSCYTSTHGRSWIHEDHGEPGDIRFDHLWLTVK